MVALERFQCRDAGQFCEWFVRSAVGFYSPVGEDLYTAKGLRPAVGFYSPVGEDLYTAKGLRPDMSLSFHSLSVSTSPTVTVGGTRYSVELITCSRGGMWAQTTETGIVFWSFAYK